MLELELNERKAEAAPGLHSKKSISNQKSRELVGRHDHQLATLFSMACSLGLPRANVENLQRKDNRSSHSLLHELSEPDEDEAAER